MDKSELHCRLFNDILKAAVEENLTQSLSSIPSEEELKKKYEPSAECRKKIMRMAKKEYHKTLLCKAAHIAKKAAIIVAIIIPISLGSLLSVEASRNAIFNTVLDWKADHVDIYFHENNSSAPESALSSGISKSVKFNYIPQGFTKSKTIRLDSLYEIIYKNKDNVSISFNQVPLSEGGKEMIDSEHTVYKEILIDGQKASLFAAKTINDKTYVLWQNNKSSFLIYSTIKADELIKMAENMIIVEN